MIWIGTSGWVYRDWAGRFYPSDLPGRDWLAFYARHFPTVEINRSYYRLPSTEQFAAWSAQAGAVHPDFCFAVKASRYVTHLKKLRGVDEAVARLAAAAAGLGDRHGPVLYQLPPRWRADPARLAGFVALLPAGQRAAFEFRDPTWFAPSLVEVLEASGCALAVGVGGPHPTPGDAPDVGPFRYLRFHHGAHGWGFGDDELAPWIERLAADPDRDAYVYFNNDPGANAIADARRCRERLAALGAPVADVPRAG